MNEIDFRNWMLVNSYNKKVISDTISRIKKIEFDLNHIDIDIEYSKDECATLLSFFKNKGDNAYASSFENCTLPIGKYQLATYKYAIQKYIKYKNETVAE